MREIGDRLERESHAMYSRRNEVGINEGEGVVMRGEVCKEKAENTSRLEQEWMRTGDLGNAVVPRGYFRRCCCCHIASGESSSPLCTEFMTA